jgi:hypothetical protein
MVKGNRGVPFFSLGFRVFVIGYWTVAYSEQKHLFDPHLNVPRQSPVCASLNVLVARPSSLGFL